MNLFKNAKLTNLEVTTSDHTPLLLEPYSYEYQRPVKRFRFENAWMREPMCGQLVAEAWSESSGKTLTDKISFCASKLEVWGSSITGCFKDRINQSKQVLKKLKGRKDAASIVKIKEEKQKLEEAYVQKEIFWRQRSKQMWLKEGDRNSRFFHASAKNRRKANHISSLRNTNGELVDWETGLEETITQYFSNLFTASNTE